MQSEDTDPPRYRLQVRIGDSGPHPDPYPFDPAGVAIRWDADPQQASVTCSRQAPQVGIGERAHALALGPDGVPGAEQDVANLYFAICHGEHGDDGALARKFGYPLHRAQ